ncbi:hypothetical protein OnM2_084031 [Erysiphe neolycopersici]|uniref:Uncharacterized protein n=1 Tax=Erysiphe neolycopersici TaxID=212602 RepID=A0A420HF54_9PEZI|nr:hypothetical protein OnM2_084031 [Erysiphe neolycopersici]
MNDSDPDDVDQFLLELSETEKDFDGDDYRNQAVIHAITGEDSCRFHNKEITPLEYPGRISVWNVEN